MSTEFAPDHDPNFPADHSLAGTSSFAEGSLVALIGNKKGEIVGECRNGHFAGVTDIGEGLKYPDTNQDSIFKIDTGDGRTVLGVVDGLGFYGGGERASEIACCAIAEDLRSGMSLSNAVGDVSLIIKDRHTAITDEAARDRLSNMTGVVTSVEIRGDEATFVHIGDSRTLLIRAGKKIHATHDHSLIQVLVDNNAISEEQSLTDPRRCVVTRFIGIQQGIESEDDPEVTRLEIKPGDLIILASDGLWDNFLSRQVVEMIGTETDPASIAKMLREAVRIEVQRRIAEALVANPADKFISRFDDNVSIVVYRHGATTNGETPQVDEYKMPGLPQEDPA